MIKIISFCFNLKCLTLTYLREGKVIDIMLKRLMQKNLHTLSSFQILLYHCANGSGLALSKLLTIVLSWNYDQGGGVP